MNGIGMLRCFWFVFLFSLINSSIEDRKTHDFLSVQSNHGRFKNRTKRQISLSQDPHVKAWRRIYFFSIKLAKALGNNALVWNMNDMVLNNMGQVSRAYTYGYYRARGGGGGRGCGGYRGYGGYAGGAGGAYGAAAMTYAMQPIYYVPGPANTGTQQQIVPTDGINGFTGDFGTAISNSDLLDQLISIIQSAIDQSYTYYNPAPDGGGGGGDYATGPSA